MASKPAQAHDISLLGADPASGQKVLDVSAEYDPQNPRSIITQRLCEALQSKIEFFTSSTPTTFRDRHKVLYVPLGTVRLRWFKKDKPVTTTFYVVHALAPQYATTNVDVVLGGSEDVNGVVANLFDESVPVLPTFNAKLSKEQKEKQKQHKQKKEEEVERAVREEEAAESQQRERERQLRLQQYQQQQRQQQQ